MAKHICLCKLSRGLPGCRIINDVENVLIFILEEVNE